MLDSDFVLWLGWPVFLVQSTALTPAITFPKWAFPQMALLGLGRKIARMPIFCDVHGDVVLVRQVIEAYPSGNKVLGILDILWQRKEADCSRFKIFSGYCLSKSSFAPRF